MQDRYAGDVGDFGKLGLLRRLCGIYPTSDPRLRLGILWYRVPDETHNNDGKHVSYLRSEVQRNERYRCCDPELYARLADLIKDERSVVRLQASEVLPSDSVHVLEQLDYAGLPRAARPAHRQAWLSAALAATGDCDVVFLDPDNGLETQSVSRFRALGPKYAYLDDLEPFIARGQSLVIYQHVNRAGSVVHQARRRTQQLQAHFGLDRIWAVRYRRGSGRLYIIVTADAHEQILRARTAELMASPWHDHGHFESFDS